MNTSKIIKAVVGGGKYTITAPIIKEDHGIYLQIDGVNLPETYEVDFSNDEHKGTSVTMIGNADGVLIPTQFIKSGRDIFAFLYHVGEDYGKTIYKFKIPNLLRPDRTNEQPIPEQQSVIDQAIAALNEAVEQTGQDAESASESAQSAKEDADFLRNASATATTLDAGSEATVNLTDGEFEFGIPRGEDAVSIQIDTDAVVIHTGSDGIFTKDETIKIHTAFYDGKTLKSVVPRPPKIKLKKRKSETQWMYVDKTATVSFGIEHDVTYVLTKGWQLYTEPFIINIDFVYEGVTYTRNIPLTVIKDGANGDKGDAGESGVYIGADEPTDENVNVWIDTDGSEDILTGLKYIKDDPSDDGGVIEGHVEVNSASGAYSHSEGDGTTASAPCSHAEGYQTTASNTCSHAEGRETNANALYAHAEGYQTTVTSACGHAEGTGNTVSGDNAHAEGNSTTASARNAHSEGGSTTASGECSHAEGAGTRATGGQAHSEGGGTLASGNQAHAEGASTTASGDNSHAENLLTTASGACSHASGINTIAQRKSQFVIGESNVADTGGSTTIDKGDYILIAGNGTTNSNRSNAMTLDWSGNEKLAGSLTLGMNTQDETTISASELKGLKEMNPIDDVQINGTSIVENGVANVPVISANNETGLVSLGGNGSGLCILNGVLSTYPAPSIIIKNGSYGFQPITPYNQHESTFYGLAKAAGDTTQSLSSNAVGAYTEDAKTAIRTMLGLEDVYQDYSSALTALGVI